MNAPYKPPTIAPPPEPESGLKEVRTKDHSGRIITTYEGEHPSVSLRQFSCNPKRVTKIRTQS
jgi:hypothetical protein